MDYARRIIDDMLDQAFPHLAAIALEGAKGVGKTATGMQRANTVVNLADAAERSLIARNVGHISQVDPPVLIDEWQLIPEVWDTVKTAVDRNGAGGRFLLAGSAGLKPGVRVHSGAGRIVRLKMRPLSLAERGVAEPTVSLASLLEGGQAALSGESPLGLGDYVEEILRSGFPGVRGLPDLPRNLQLDSYLARIVDSELPENGVTVRHPDALRRWLRAYGAATSTDARFSTILAAATPGEPDKPARATVQGYREHLTRLFILDPLDAWRPAFNPLSALTNTPKHHLVDPALAARLVGVGRAGLLRGEGVRVGGARASGGTWLGALFESLAVQSVRVYAEAANARVAHMRLADSRREIDIIVEREDQSVVAIEVKLASDVNDGDAKHLNWLKDQIGDRVIDRVILNTGSRAMRLQSGVAVVPLALLGP